MPHGRHILKTASEMDMAKNVYIHNHNMHHHIGNVFYNVVNNVHVFIYQVQNQIITFQMLSPQ